MKKSSNTKDLFDSASEPFLVRTDTGLALRALDMEVVCDFSILKKRICKDSLNKEFLIKASKIKQSKGDFPVAIDATAGLAHDSFLLAAWGFKVYLFEREQLIYELVKDGLDRARQDETIAEVAYRMQIINDDFMTASDFLLANNLSVDLVYLDPMFPNKRHKASSKKKLQILQMLESPCKNEKEMLKEAFRCAPQKVVVKRSAKGAYIGDVRPVHSLMGKMIRFDVYYPHSVL